MLPARSKAPRILFFGMRCDFSAPPLDALLAAGLDVCAVALPAAGRPDPRRGRPGAEPVRHLSSTGSGTALPLLAARRMRTIADVAGEGSLPILEVSRLADRRAGEALAAWRPDLICVACFPWRLPPAILALPPLGCLNVHPSLLPANRGPVPLFWTFRLGERRTGVTVHLMAETLDAGDVVAQEPVDVPDGISGRELELACAERGGRLLVAAVRSLAAGTARPTKQVADRASYQGWPTPDDFVVDPGWSARRAFNFIRGVSHWGTPLVEVHGDRLPVAAAIGYEPDRVLGDPAVMAGEDCWIQCSSGVLQVVVARPRL